MDKRVDITQQIEPVRKTFLDVLRDNLEIASRATFVHRLIYIGEHRFTRVRGRSIGDSMKRTIVTVNEGFRDEPLSGILLFYQQLFCHVLEGSEDSLAKHLLLLGSNEDTRNRLGRMKMLVCYHHVNQRFLQGWIAVTGKPPALLERIDNNSDVHATSRHVLNCVQKLYKLALFQQPKTQKRNRASGKAGAAAPVRQEQGRIGGVKYVVEKHPECLPEFGLLDFLLSTPYTQDIRHYIDIYGVIPPMDFYKDKVWPVPGEFIPFNIFDKLYDPIPDLPTTKQEEGSEIQNVNQRNLL